MCWVIPQVWTNAPTVTNRRCLSMLLRRWSRQSVSSAPLYGLIMRIRSEASFLIPFTFRAKDFSSSGVEGALSIIGKHVWLVGLQPLARTREHKQGDPENS